MMSRSAFGRVLRSAAGPALAVVLSPALGTRYFAAAGPWAGPPAAADTTSSRNSPAGGAAARAGPYTPQPLRCEDGTFVIPWTSPPRAHELSRLQNEEFDVVVIGGGCVGAGVAWEAATRGLRVALVERSDFAAGTSGRSTKLIHGGIRYLESAVWNLDVEMLHMVQEALSERAHLMNAAPYMTHPLPTIIPIYKWWEVPYMWLGAQCYDLIAGRRRGVLPRSYYISKDEALFQFPMLKGDGLKGGVVYYDGMHNDTRMNLMIAMTAAQRGAAIANYVETTAVAHDAAVGRVSGVAVRDALSGREWTVRARAVVNATGCFGDAVRAMDDPAAAPLIVGAAGVHIVLPDHFSPDAMGLIVPKTRDGRVLFFLPWEGMTLCGTTDAPAAISMAPAPLDEDVRFIIEESNRYLARKVSIADVRAAWSGIRPLLKDPAKLALGGSGGDGKGGGGTSQLSRKHVVEVSRSGMVSILGGKWTTYRQMAQDAVDAVAKEHGLAVEPSTTQGLQLLGADRAGIVFNKNYDRIPVTLRESYGFDKDVARHLARNYGTRALQVAQLATAPAAAAAAAAVDPAAITWSSSGGGGSWAAHGPLAARLAPRHPFILAEVAFAVRQEYAMTAVDVLARRTRLAFLDAAAARAALPAVVAVMAPLLGWDAPRCAAEAAAAEAFLATMITPAAAAVAQQQQAAVAAAQS